MQGGPKLKKREGCLNLLHVSVKEAICKELRPIPGSPVSGTEGKVGSRSPPSQGVDSRLRKGFCILITWKWSSTIHNLTSSHIVYLRFRPPPLSLIFGIMIFFFRKPVFAPRSGTSSFDHELRKWCRAVFCVLLAFVSLCHSDQTLWFRINLLFVSPTTKQSRAKDLPELRCSITPLQRNGSLKQLKWA